MRLDQPSMYPKTYSFLNVPVRWKALLLIVALGAMIDSVKGQEGRFLRADYGIQYLQSRSLDDATILGNNPRFQYLDTWSHGGGLTYVHNFDTAFGYSIGALLSRKGQDYEGELTENNTIRPFDASLRLQYLEMPLLFRFNSFLENPEEGGYLELSVGFSAGYLLGGARVTAPYLSEGRSLSTEYLFRNYEFNTVVSARFNFVINAQWAVTTGIRATRTIGSIEKNDISFPENARLESYYPVSLPKSFRPSTFEMQDRRAMKNTVVNFNLGISRRL